MASQGMDKTDMQHPVSAPNGKLLTVSQASEFLNAHPNSVRRWADLGLLPVHRIGLRGDRRFERKVLARFLDAWDGAK